MTPLASEVNCDSLRDEQARHPSLMVLTGHPPRYQFLHSSLAELIFHALAPCTEGDIASIHEMATAALIDHFGRDNRELGIELLKILHAPLALQGKEAANFFKARLLERSEIQETILGIDSLSTRLKIFSQAAFRLRLVESPLLQKFTSLLVDAMRQWLDQPCKRDGEFSVWILAFKNLQKANKDHALTIEKQIGSKQFLRLIEDNGTVFELFKFTEYASPETARSLIDLLNDRIVEKLVNKTITSNRSIGTLSLSLFELRKSVPDIGFALEQAIGSAQLLRLIEGNGTVLELFKLTQYVSPKTARALIGFLNDRIVEKLVNKTITSNRSIGTLSLSLFELRKSAPDIGLELEQAIGAAQLLRLIEGNGTVYELFTLAQHARAETVREMIGLLSEHNLKALIDKTIASGRSIGTLGLALFEFRKSAPDIGLALELAIGATQFLRLVEDNGTVFELFKFAENSSAKTAREIIRLLSDRIVKKLVDKTIASSRSIGTLHMALFALRKSAPDIGLALEQAIGASQLLRLVEANGTVFELFQLAQYTSEKMAMTMIDLLDDSIVNNLVGKTIAAQRSIGTLSLTLRASKQRDGAVGSTLESKFGVHRFWLLMTELGNPKTLADLTESMSETFCLSFFTHGHDLDRAAWNSIFGRGSLFEATNFIARCPNWIEDATMGPLIVEALSLQADRLTDESDWMGLNTAALQLEKSTTPSIRATLETALHQRLSTIDVETLALPGFDQAVAALNLLGRETPSCKPLLARRLWQILPPPTDWTKPTAAFLQNISWLAGMLADQTFSPADAKRVLTVGLAPDKAAMLSKARPLHLFLYLWSLHGLWSFHLQQNGPSFKSLIPPPTLQNLLGIAKQFADKRLVRNENLKLLALLGLLAHLDCPLPKQTLDVLAGRFDKAKRHIGAGLLEQTFVPAYFGLRGLELIFPGRFSINAFMEAQLMALADQYPKPTSAVLALRATLDKSRR